MQKILFSKEPAAGRGPFGKKLPLDERLMLRIEECAKAGDMAGAGSYAKMLSYAQLYSGNFKEFTGTAMYGSIKGVKVSPSDLALLMDDFLEIKIRRNDVDAIDKAMRSGAIPRWYLINLLMRTRRHAHLSQIATKGLFGISSDEVANAVSSHVYHRVLLGIGLLRLSLLKDILGNAAAYAQKNSLVTSESFQEGKLRAYLARQLKERNESELSSLVEHGLISLGRLSKLCSE